MIAAEHVLSYLRLTWNQTTRDSLDCPKKPNVLWGLVMLIGPVILTPIDCTRDSS